MPALLGACLVFATWASASCDSPDSTAETSAGPVAPRIAAPVLPGDAQRFAPAQVDIEGGATRTGADLADVERCEGCHAEAVRTWRSSVHAFASFNNPLYRFSVDEFKRKHGQIESRFCGGCHDPALLVDGAMDDDVAADDPRARAGITCEICHNAVAVRPGGNAAYTLGAEPLPIPEMENAASIEAHKRAAAPSPLKTSALCGTCHKAFLGDHTGHPHYFAGQDEMLPWKRSAFAGSLAERVDELVDRKDCKACHMPQQTPHLADASGRKGTLASHRMAGGHTLLAAMRGDTEQLEATADMLRDKISVDVAVARTSDGEIGLPAEELDPAPGAHVDFDVVLRNLGVGHMFPGGTIDLQDTWLEVVVRDATGAVVADSGVDHERTARDPSAHRVRVEILDEDGEPVRAHEVERIRAVGYSHAIASRDAVAVRYAFVVPDEGAFAAPLAVSVRVRHRARTIESRTSACDDHQTERGQVFAAPDKLDACVEAPVIDIATVRVELGSGVAPEGALATHARLENHARAMLKGVQEEVELAAPSIELALLLAERTGDAEARARVLSLAGELASRQGRADDALLWFDEAEALTPAHPALAMGRGRALAQVWRFAEAAPHFARAAELAPLDETTWAQLALALGSAGDPSAALAAAQSGLAQAGRNPDLLRSQALALRKLAPDDPWTRIADEVHLYHRTLDEAPDLRAACSTNVPGCALERQPLHVHRMRERLGASATTAEP